MNSRHHADLDATISQSGRAVLAPAPVAPSEQAGQMIGRYKLLQPIGEGGFGSVWMAEQREPVKRRVALKIIKLGMDTKQVIARFEAERQALAMMDHPNIAKVLDAGATETGRPYFVMEYIKGVPILEYCDTDKLDTKARLALFSNVCHAIQHAHQKGIIHRDIKPSNVLITMHDGVPVPKVIDFGIAKATCAELTTKTLFTEHRQMIGTPAYMSPEQAEMSGLDIDTRSDIYSLGVLLYELLTGTTPFAHEELMSKGFAEMMRIIREVEPHKPSTRLSSLGDTGTRTALQRHAGDVKKLGLILRGDLDWIVMKCLEKDRTRRYETANGLAADINRHLSDQPVTAAAPSAGYKLRKFVKRNRGQVMAAGVVAGALVLGVVGTTRGMVWALNEKTRADVEKNNATLAAAAEAKAKVEAQENEKRALAEAKKAEGVTKFLERMFAAADPHTEQRPGLTMREMLDEVAPTVATSLADQPEVQARIHSTIGLAYQHLGEFGQAESHLKRALELWRAATGDDAPDGLADATFRFGWLYHDMRDYTQAEQVLRGAQALTVKNHGADSLQAYGVLAYVADLQRHMGDYIKAEKLLREVIAKTEGRGDDGARHTRYALRILSLVLTESGRPAEGEETQRRLDAMVGTDDARNITERLTSLSVLRESLESQGKLAEARDLADQAIVLVRQQAATDRDDPYWMTKLVAAMEIRARLALQSSDAESAERMYAEQVEVSRKLIGLQPENPHWPTFQAAAFQDWGNLSKSPWNRADTTGHFQDAVDTAREGLVTFPNNTNLYKYLQHNLYESGEAALIANAPEKTERLYLEQLDANNVLRTLEPTDAFWPRNQSYIVERLGRIALARWDRGTASGHFNKAVEFAKAGTLAFPKDAPLKTQLASATSWADWLAKLPPSSAASSRAAPAPGGTGRNAYRVSFECTRVTDARTVETVEGFQLRPQGTWWLHKIDDNERNAAVRAAFEALVLGGAGKRVEVEFDGYLAYKDRAGIMYANIYVDGACVNEKMLREGYYDLYDRIDYKSKEKYRALRDEAKAAGRGMWAIASPSIETTSGIKR